MQDQEIQQALTEAVASLEEIQQLRLTDPEGAELLQLEKELQEAVDSLRASLDPLQSTPESTVQHASPAEKHQKATAAIVHEQPNLISDRPAQKQRVSRRQPGMHPSNQYAAEEPDFAALAREYPELLPFVKAERGGRASLAFDNPDANR